MPDGHSRRHLSESQRAMVAARLANLTPGTNQHTPIGGTSQTKAAELLNVGTRAVQRATVVQDEGTAILVAAVEAGACLPMLELHHVGMDDPLNAAIARLAAFRASWEPEDEIDESSHLTARDLDVILAQLSWPEGEDVNPTMRELR